MSRQWLEAPVFSEAGDPAIAMLAENQVPGRVKQEAVGAGLAAAGLLPGIAGRSQVDAEPLSILPSHHPVVGDVGEENGFFVRQPHGALAPGEAAGELFDDRALGDEVIEARVEADDLAHAGIFRSRLVAPDAPGGADAELHFGAAGA